MQSFESDIQVEMEVKDEKIRILQNKVDSMEEVYQNVLADSFGKAIFHFYTYVFVLTYSVSLWLVNSVRAYSKYL